MNCETALQFASVAFNSPCETVYSTQFTRALSYECACCHKTEIKRLFAPYAVLNVKWNTANNPKDVLVKSGKLCAQCEEGEDGI